MPFEALAQLYASIQRQLVDAMEGAASSEGGALRPANAVGEFLSRQLQQLEKQVGGCCCRPVG